MKVVTAGSNVGDSWAEYIKQQKEEELKKIIEEEKLRPLETKNFMDMAFRNGFVSISGTAFAQILPAMSRFAKGNKREEVRQRVYEKLCAYLEKFKDLSNPSDESEEDFYLGNAQVHTGTDPVCTSYHSKKMQLSAYPTPATDFQ